MTLQISAAILFQKANLQPLKAQLRNELKDLKVDISIGLDRGATTRVQNLSSKLNALSTVLRTVQADSLATANAIDRLTKSFGGLSSSGANAANLSKRINTNFGSTASAIDKTSKSIDNFGQRVELAGKRFVAFTVFAGAFIGFTQSLRSGVSEALNFQRQLIRLTQVGGDSATELAKVQKTITDISTTFGVSSKELVEVAVTLRQAGIAGAELRQSLEAIGKASLAPTFKDINQVAEGSIAILKQFRLEASQLERSLDSINAVSAAYAVEADDLITAVQKTGGVFSALGGDLNQLISLFTSVRSTTRESADTIATGFRTIFGRLQRPKVVDELKELGVNLRFTREEAEALGDVNLEEQFVKPLEAIRRISSGLGQIQPTDPRFAAIVEQIGGVRQISKVIPLIREFTTTQEALNIALSSSGSITQSAVTAQGALLVQVTKLKEEFFALFRAVTESSTFQNLASLSLTLARSFVVVADALRPLLPLITTLATIQIGKLFATIPLVQQNIQKVNPLKRSSGGYVPGSGSGDIVPAMLEPGEFVLRKSAVQKLGGGTVESLNARGYAKGGSIRKAWNEAGGTMKGMMLDNADMKHTDSIMKTKYDDLSPFSQEMIHAKNMGGRDASYMFGKGWQREKFARTGFSRMATGGKVRDPARDLFHLNTAMYEHQIAYRGGDHLPLYNMSRSTGLNPVDAKALKSGRQQYKDEAQANFIQRSSQGRDVLTLNAMDEAIRAVEQHGRSREDIADRQGVIQNMMGLENPEQAGGIYQPIFNRGVRRQVLDKIRRIKLKAEENVLLNRFGGDPNKIPTQHRSRFSELFGTQDFDTGGLVNIPVTGKNLRGRASLRSFDFSRNPVVTDIFQRIQELGIDPNKLAKSIEFATLRTGQSDVLGGEFNSRNLVDKASVYPEGIRNIANRFKTKTSDELRFALAHELGHGLDFGLSNNTLKDDDGTIYRQALSETDRAMGRIGESRSKLLTAEGTPFGGQAGKEGIADLFASRVLQGSGRQSYRSLKKPKNIAREQELFGDFDRYVLSQARKKLGFATGGRVPTYDFSKKFTTDRGGRIEHPLVNEVLDLISQQGINPSALVDNIDFVPQTILKRVLGLTKAKGSISNGAFGRSHYGNEKKVLLSQFGINKTAKFGNISPDDMLRYVVGHEFGHGFDLALGDKGLSLVDQFNIYNKSGRFSEKNPLNDRESLARSAGTLGLNRSLLGDDEGIGFFGDFAKEGFADLFAETILPGIRHDRSLNSPTGKKTNSILLERFQGIMNEGRKLKSLRFATGGQIQMPIYGQSILGNKVGIKRHPEVDQILELIADQGIDPTKLTPSINFVNQRLLKARLGIGQNSRGMAGGAFDPRKDIGFNRVFISGFGINEFARASGIDPKDMLRFTLAHELGHALDYKLGDDKRFSSDVYGSSALNLGKARHELALSEGQKYHFDSEYPQGEGFADLFAETILDPIGGNKSIRALKGSGQRSQRSNLSKLFTRDILGNAKERFGFAEGGSVNQSLATLGRLRQAMDDIVLGGPDVFRASGPTDRTSKKKLLHQGRAGAILSGLDKEPGKLLEFLDAELLGATHIGKERHGRLQRLRPHMEKAIIKYTSAKTGIGDADAQGNMLFPDEWQGYDQGGKVDRQEFLRLVQSSAVGNHDIPFSMEDLIYNEANKGSLNKILNLIPQGTQSLGAGAEASVLKLPNGNVLRLSAAGSSARVASDRMLQPINKQQIGKFDVEELPFAPSLKSLVKSGRISENRSSFIMAALMNRIQKSGLDIGDFNPANVGIQAGRGRGRIKGIDPGAIYDPKEFATGGRVTTALAQTASVAGRSTPNAFREYIQKQLAGYVLPPDSSKGLPPDGTTGLGKIGLRQAFPGLPSQALNLSSQKGILPILDQLLSQKGGATPPLLGNFQRGKIGLDQFLASLKGLDTFPPITEVLDKDVLSTQKQFAITNRSKDFPLRVRGFNSGGEVPAMLEPGEFVVNRQSAQVIGNSALRDLNRGKVDRFHSGGKVKGYALGDSISTEGSVNAIPQGGQILRLFLSNLKGVSDAMVSIMTNLARAAAGLEAIKTQPKAFDVSNEVNTPPPLPAGIIDPRLETTKQRPPRIPTRFRGPPGPPTNPPDDPFDPNELPISFASEASERARLLRDANGTSGLLRPKQEIFRLTEAEDRASRQTRPGQGPQKLENRGKFAGVEAALRLEGFKANQQAGIPLDAAQTRAAVASNKYSEIMEKLVNVEQQAIQATNKSITADNARAVASERVGRALADNAQVLVKNGEIIGLQTSVNALEKAGKSVVPNQSGGSGLRGFGNRVGEGFGRFAQSGGLFAIPAIAAGLNQATGNSEAGQAITSGLVGGASGGAFGSFVGNGRGGNFALAGAGVGALDAFVSSLFKSASNIEQAKIGEALQKVTKELNDFSTAGLGSVGSIANDINRLRSSTFTGSVNRQRADNGLFGNAAATIQDVFSNKGIGSTFSKQAQAETRQSIQGLSPQIAQALNRSTQELIKNNTSLLNTGKNEIQLRKEVEQTLKGNEGSEKLIAILANNLDQPTAKIRDEFVKLGVAVIRQIELEKKRNDAIQQTQLGTQAISLFTQTLNEAAFAAEKFEGRLAGIEESASGQFGVRTGRNFSKEIDTFGQRGGNFQKATGDLLGQFGNLGNNIQTTVSGFEEVGKVLPQALASIGNNLESGTNPSALLADSVRKLSPNLSAGGKAALGLVSARLPADPGDIKKGLEGGVVAFAQDLIKDAGGEFQKTLKELAEAVDNHNTEVASVFARQRALNEQVNNQIQSRISSEEDLAKLQSEIQGQRTGRDASTIFSPAVAEGFFNQRQAALVGPGLAGANGAALVGERDNVRSQIQELEKQRETAAPGVGFDSLTKDISSLQQRFGNLNKAIDNTINVQGRSAAIQGRLNDVQQERSRQRNTSEQFVRGDLVQRLEILRGVQLAGQFKGLETDQQREQFVGGLNQQDVGRLLEQLPDKLRAKAQDALVPGLGKTDLAKEEKTLQDQLIIIQTEAVSTQKKLEESNKALALEFSKLATDKLITSQETLRNSIDNLKKSFETQREATANVRAGEAKKLAEAFPNAKTFKDLKDVQDNPNVPKFLEEQKKLQGLVALKESGVDASGVRIANTGGAKSIDAESLITTLTNALGSKNIAVEGTGIRDFVNKQDLSLGISGGPQRDPGTQIKTLIDKFLTESFGSIVFNRTSVPEGVANTLVGAKPEGLGLLKNADLTKFDQSKTLAEASIPVQSARVIINNAVISGIPGVSSSADAVSQQLAKGGTVKRFANGGSVGTDTVPALLTPGEFVMNRASTGKFLPLLHAMNASKFAGGGFVGGLLDLGNKRNEILAQLDALEPFKNDPNFKAEFDALNERHADIQAQLNNVAGNVPDNFVPANQLAVGNAAAPRRQVSAGPSLRGQQIGNLQLSSLLQANRGFGGREADIARGSIASSLALANQDLERRILEFGPGASGGRGNLAGRRTSRRLGAPAGVQNEANAFAAAQAGQNAEIIGRRDRENSGFAIERKRIAQFNQGVAERTAALREQTLGIREGVVITPTQFARGSKELDPNLFRGRASRVGHFASGGSVGGGASGNSNLGVDIGRLSEGFANFETTVQTFGTASASLSQAMLQFSANNTALSEAMNNFPREITMQAQHTVEVILNGAEVMSELMPEIQRLVIDGAKSELNAIIKDKFTGLGPVV